MSPSVHVLLLTDDADQRRTWHDALAASGCRISSSAAELADGDDLDVVVTDRSVVAETLAARHKQLSRGELAVVTIGGGGLADVALPRDASSREIKLACLLLGEVVRLRRQNRKGERTRKVLSQLALSDPLTGLPNRRAWEEELRARLESAAASRLPVALALFDLDHFKQINTQFGHARGDKVLKETGHALVSQSRRRDYAARLGGDEFGLIVAGLEATAAARAIERIRAALAAKVRPADDYSLTASAGFAAVDSTSGTVDLFARADEALRRAKAEGRDRLVQSACN